MGESRAVNIRMLLQHLGVARLFSKTDVTLVYDQMVKRSVVDP